MKKIAKNKDNKNMGRGSGKAKTFMPNFNLQNTERAARTERMLAKRAKSK